MIVAAVPTNLDALRVRSEFLDLDPYDDHDFEELVRDALDDLPELLRPLIENHNVAVVISWLSITRSSTKRRVLGI